MAENTSAEQRLGGFITGDMVTDVMSGTRRIDLTDLAAAVEVLSDIDIPAELRDNLALFLRLERRILREYDAKVLDVFDELMMNVIRANAGDPGAEADGEAVDAQGMPASDTPSACAFRDAVALIDALPMDQAQEQREVITELGGDIDVGQDLDGRGQVGQVDAAGAGHHVGDHIAGDELSEPLLCRRILCHATSLIAGTDAPRDSVRPHYYRRAMRYLPTTLVR